MEQSVGRDAQLGRQLLSRGVRVLNLRGKPVDGLVAESAPQEFLV